VERGTLADGTSRVRYAEEMAMHWGRAMRDRFCRIRNVDLEPYGLCPDSPTDGLNRPNDVVVKSDGAIYFSDPNTNMVPDQTDLTYAGVYRISPDLGTLTLLVSDFITPNGLAFSPDESVLYVNDSRRRHSRALDMAPNGTLARQTDRVFADLGGPESGVPDGMKVDSAGNVYCGGAGGIYILDPKGRKLGRIIHGQPQTTNLAFGGPDWRTLYFTNWNFLGSVNLKIAGAGG
jgi:gluconolactonase